MVWLYIRYGKVMPSEIMNNQGTMQSMYKIEDPVEIIFNQIEVGKEFAIVVNSTFTDRQLSDMRTDQIIATE